MASLATVTTLRGSLEDTLLFVNYHVNSGLDQMYLFFDDPEDPAVERLAGSDRVRAVRCDAAHWAASGLPEKPSVEQKQLYNADLALGWARDEGLDWIAHIDNDELLYARHGLGASLDSVDQAYDVATFKAYEAVPDRPDHAVPMREITTFRVAPEKGRYARIGRLLASHAFFEGEYIRGYASGKSAVRTRADVTAMGLHWPDLGGTTEYARATVPDAGVLHFDGCTYELWKTKNARRVSGAATHTTLRKNRYRQIDAFASVQGDEAAMTDLFDKLYLIPGWARLPLRALGMLKTVTLDQSLFETPSPTAVT